MGNIVHARCDSICNDVESLSGANKVRIHEEDKMTRFPLLMTQVSPQSPFVARVIASFEMNSQLIFNVLLAVVAA